MVLVYIAYHERSNLKSLPALARAPLRYLDFVLLPVVFWGIKLLFYQPYGRYRGYNQVTLESAVAGLPFIDNALIGGFIEPLVDSFSGFLALPLWVLLLATLIAFLGARALARLDATDSAGRRFRHGSLGWASSFSWPGYFPTSPSARCPRPRTGTAGTSC